MYKSVREDFGSNASALVFNTFWWTIRCRNVADSINWLICQTFNKPRNKRNRTTFRSNRTRYTNKANRLIESLNLYLDELKELIKNIPRLHDHQHVSFVMRFAEETIETLKEDFANLERVAILVGFDV